MVRLSRFLAIGAQDLSFLLPTRLSVPSRQRPKPTTVRRLPRPTACCISRRSSTSWSAPICQSSWARHRPHSSKVGHRSNSAKCLSLPGFFPSWAMCRIIIAIVGITTIPAEHESRLSPCFRSNFGYVENDKFSDVENDKSGDKNDKFGDVTSKMISLTTKMISLETKMIGLATKMISFLVQKSVYKLA